MCCCDCFDDLETKYKIAIPSCCAIFITLVILFSVSWSALEPTEYGIRYNANTLKLDTEQIYTEGRYLLGVGHRFIKFPRDVQTVTFSSDAGSSAGVLTARTFDGLSVVLDISFNYRLQGDDTDRMVSLYLNFGTDYETAFISIARNVCRDVAGDFRAFQYFQNRTLVQNSMADELSLKLQDTFAIMDSFQLRNIALPEEFETAVQLTQIAREQIEEAEAQKDRADVEAETTIETAIEEARIILNAAEADATEIRLTAQANAEALNLTIGAERDAYSNLKTVLQLDETEDLLTYMWLQAIAETGVEDVIMGVGKPDDLF